MGGWGKLWRTAISFLLLAFSCRTFGVQAGRRPVALMAISDEFEIIS